MNSSLNKSTNVVLNNSRFIKFLFLACVILFFPLRSFAAQCLDVFPGVISSSINTGTATIASEVDIIGTNGQINIGIASDQTSNSNPSCVTGRCTDSGNRGTALDLPVFQSSSSTQDFTVNNGVTDSLAQGAYDQVTLRFRANLRLTQNNQITYIKTLSATSGQNTITFDEGTYWIENFNTGFRNNIVINGNDKVTLIIGNMNSATEVTMNVDGSPEQLAMVVYDSVTFAYRNKFNGYLYLDGNFTTGTEVEFTGAISAQNINLQFRNEFTSDLDGLSESAFAGLCDFNSATLIASYQFEDSLWDGSSGEIIDSSGNGYHGQVRANVESANSIPAIDASLGTCGYADFDSGSIRVPGLPVDTSPGAKTTVAFWMRWDGTDSVMPIGWNQHNLWIYVGDIGFNTFSNDQWGRTSADLANTWRHVVAEFTNGDVTQNRLFIDGVEQTLSERFRTADNTKAYVNPQMVIGGDFANSTFDFHGAIDEVKVYDGVLSDAQIQSLVTETRPCAIDAPTLEYRFDELNWSGSPNEVLENRNSGFDGVAVDGANISGPGLVCRAAGFDGTNYVDVTGFSDDLSKTATVTYWVKTDQNGNNTAWSAPGVLGVEQGGTGNDIFWGYIDASKRLRMQKGNGSAAISTTTVADGNWHHIALTYNSDTGAAQLYVNGTLEDSVTTETGVVTNAFGRIGEIQGGYASVDFVGELDELLVFDSVLSAANIREIFSNQLAGNNYDGSTRSCSSELFNLRMDESLWTGAEGEVVDQTGNYNAEAVNGISTSASTVDTNRAIPGNPGTCGYGDFDGDDDYVVMPTSFPNLTDSFTITAWINPTTIDQDSRIFIDDETPVSSSRGYGFSLGDSGRPVLRFYSRNVRPIIVDGTSTIPLNTWTFVTAVHDAENKTRRFYINGVAEPLTIGANVSTYTGSWGEDNGVATIGGETANGEILHSFHGGIDEVRVFDGALTQNEVLQVYRDTHACQVPVVHHYEIEHDGEGLTCDAETITIKACENEACSSLSSQAVSLNVLADGSIIGNPSFVGSTTLSFNNTDVETLTFSVSNESISPSSGLICDSGTVGGGNSCDIAFADAGFRFLSGSTNSPIIPNQRSGITFAEAIKIQAVKDNNGVCTGLFDGARTVALSQENVNPGGVTGLDFSLGGSTIAKHTGSTSVALTFDADSIATLPAAIYNDAGQIRLRASYNEGGVSLLGSSNAFWVSPASFLIEAIAGTTNLDGDSASSAITHPAGEDFTFRVTALNGATTPIATPNYQPGQLQMQLTRTGPTLAGSADGSFTFNTATSLNSSLAATMQNVNLANFVNGVSTFSAAQFSEVGLINIDLQDADYGNQGIVVNAAAIDVGRFTPHYFEQTIAQNGVLGVPYTDVAGGSTTSFIAFSGQKDEATNTLGAITYVSRPTFAITAYNKQGMITQNFFQDSEGSANDFMKLSASNIGLEVPTTDESAQGVDGSLLPLTASINAGVLSQNNLTVTSGTVALPRGTVHYQLSSSDHFFYNRSLNAMVDPFTSDINFAITGISDADGINATSLVDAAPTGVEIRFGRMVVQNSFGPETANFPQTLLLEHFTSNGFVKSNDNSFVGVDPSDVVLSNISLDPDLSAVLGSASDFTNGQSQVIVLQATGAGNQGQILVTYDAIDWLEYDWDADGALDDDPSGIATFGIYRGNDRTIHWREVFND
jgi:MSHA biogenesis protein MshQ